MPSPLCYRRHQAGQSGQSDVLSPVGSIPRGLYDLVSLLYTASKAPIPILLPLWQMNSCNLLINKSPKKREFLQSIFGQSLVSRVTELFCSLGRLWSTRQMFLQVYRCSWLCSKKFYASEAVAVCIMPMHVQAIAIAHRKGPGTPVLISW